ncbi:MAG: four helix bundle protein [Lentisphaeria bacterium]|nr:four helix bundle protein [Lentisphaeria bacterium]
MSKDIADKAYHFTVEVLQMHANARQRTGDFLMLTKVMENAVSLGEQATIAKEALSGQEQFNAYSSAYQFAIKTQYWLRILTDTGYVDFKTMGQLLGDARELSADLKIVVHQIKQKMSPAGMKAATKPRIKR